MASSDSTQCSSYLKNVRRQYRSLQKLNYDTYRRLQALSVEKVATYVAKVVDKKQRVTVVASAKVADDTSSI